MNIKQSDALKNLAAIFFISGFCALIYQLSWQRLLFTSFGVDLTSITIIISIFMAGLGVGAFFGGRIADAFPKKTLVLFCLIEALIGIYGLCSYQIIHIFNDFSSGFSELSIMSGLFGILIFPTFLMGATLPLLTAHFNRKIKNIGQSIGTLYFVNTLGAAFGALVTGFMLFSMFGLSVTILIAGGLNLAISALVFVMYGLSADE